jgi:hypothetical protein
VQLHRDDGPLSSAFLCALQVSMSMDVSDARVRGTYALSPSPRSLLTQCSRRCSISAINGTLYIVKTSTWLQLQTKWTGTNTANSCSTERRPKTKNQKTGGVKKTQQRADNPSDRLPLPPFFRQCPMALMANGVSARFSPMRRVQKQHTQSL